MDNVVTNIGRTCTAQALFGSTSVAAGNCQPRGNFQYIGIGTDSHSEITADTGLGNGISSVNLASGFSNPQARSVYTLTNSTGATGAIAAQTTSFLFSGSQTIAEADLQDATSTGNTANQHTFARKAISPGIGVNSGDTLTVTWTITTG